MSCENNKPGKKVDLYRATRQFERFLNTDFCCDDKEGMHRPPPVRYNPDDFKVIANIIFYPDEQRVEVKRVDEEQENSTK